MAGAIAYNTNSLQTAGIITSEIDHHSAPDNDVTLLAIAFASRNKAINNNVSGKTITIAGKLVAASASAMDTLEDTFKGYLVGREKNLDIEHASGTRRYIVTPAAVRVERPGGLSYADFMAKFLCSSPFGVDLAATVLDNTTGYTSATRNIAVTFVGSAEHQHPIIRITLNSGTQLSNGTISIGNNSNGQVLQITRNWVVGDVITIDTYEMLVKVNNVEVVFAGAVPIFETGAQTITYADTFLTRSVDHYVEQYGRWQ